MRRLKSKVVKVVISIMILSMLSGCNSKKKDNKESSSSTSKESVQTETNDNKEINTKAVNGDECKYIEERKDEYSNCFNVKKFFVYGTHFNFEGSISLKKLDNKKVESVSLCLVNIAKDEKDVSKRIEKAIKINSEVDGKKVKIKSSSTINNGLFLENIKEGTYAFYLAIKTEGGNVYIPLANDTKEKDIKYYTVTNLKDKSNKEINIYTPKEVKKNYDKKYMFIKCHKEKLPDDVYDIVIDPGHGGTDVGAIHEHYYEKNLSLDVAKMVYEKLKEKGYKVLITRDGSEETNGEYSVYSTYEEYGRVTLACKARAKYALSIHLNSSEADMDKGGVQIYCSGKGDTSMARRLCDNLVEEANTYTSNLAGRLLREEGVYSHTFGDTEMSEIRGIAAQYGFKPYDIKYGDDYLYMIRELGGISTNAYTDGRHPDYGKNKWVNANYGIECCLCELAYMSVEDDLNYFLDHKEDYAEGLVKGLVEEIEKDN